MIVLDEQLLGRGIEDVIARWYPGAVRFINELRPRTVIKDESVPVVLGSENEPTFVTINETDFWRRVMITNRFCIVCFALPDARADEVPSLLKRLLHNPEFRTKAQRMGRVVRVTSSSVSYYTVDDQTVRAVEGW